MEEYNAFIFEHMNGILKELVHSPSAINHQIANNYATIFLSNLNKSYDESSEWKLSKNKTKIKRDSKTITTLNSESSKTTNYFVVTKDKSYYLIQNFLIMNETECFLGTKFKVEKFRFNYKNFNLSLDHILHCELTDCQEYIEITQIERKVHFVREFKKSSSQTEYERKCHFVDIRFKYHN